MSLPPGAQNMDQNAQEIAALVEDHEAQSWLAFARAAAAQPDNPMGAVAEEHHAVPLTAMTAVNFSAMNKVIGLGVNREVSDQELDDVEQFFARHGQTRFSIEVAPTQGNESLESRLLQRGYTPLELGMAKSWRSLDDLPPRREGYDVRHLSADDAGAWSLLHRRVRNMPRMFGAWFTAGFGDDNFHHFGVFDGDTLVAGAAMYVTEGLMWCGFSATLEEARGRGLQTAIVIERFYWARGLGARIAHVENESGSPGRPGVALHNMHKLGFHTLYQRRAYAMGEPAPNNE